jgi:hypothetical protein
MLANQDASLSGETTSSIHLDTSLTTVKTAVKMSKARYGQFLFETCDPIFSGRYTENGYLYLGREMAK